MLADGRAFHNLRATVAVVNPARRDRHSIAGPMAVVFAAVIMVASCSDRSASTWCEDARTLTDVVVGYRNMVDFPDPTQLRGDLSGAIAARARAISEAGEGTTDAFETLGLAIVDLDRVLGRYDYDLLRAQSESDSGEQDEMFAVEGQPVADALLATQAEIGRRCHS